MKVSKEEIVGMVKAIEMLRSGKRNRDAEDKEWRAWFLHITNTRVQGSRGFRRDHRAEGQAVLPDDESRLGRRTRSASPPAKSGSSCSRASRAS